LITEQGFAKISDFGISKRNSFAPGISRNRSGSVYKQKRMSQKGTPNWMAPEVIKNQGYSAKADIWSLGCTIIEMATGAKPWKGFDLAMAIFSQLNQNKAPPLTSISSPQTATFVERCFEM
jgi:serine/threonine protein kinase